MTPPHYPAAFEPDAAGRRPAEQGGRRRAEMQGALYGEPDRPARPGTGPSAASSPPRNPTARFDLRAEFAAMASVSDPFTLQERSERLVDRFDREYRAPAPHGRHGSEATRRDVQGGSRPMSVPGGFEQASGLAGELAQAGELAAPVVAPPEPGGRPGMPARGLAGELPLAAEGPVVDRPPPAMDPDSAPGMPPLNRADRGIGQFTGSLVPPGAGERMSGPGGPPAALRGPEPARPPDARREQPMSPPSGVPRVPIGMPPGAGERMSGPGGPPAAPQGSEPPARPPDARREQPMSPPSGIPGVVQAPPMSPPSGVPQAQEGTHAAPAAPPPRPGPPPQGAAPPPLGAVQQPLPAPQGPQVERIAPPSSPPKPEAPRPWRHQGRSDGGFGPMGSGNWNGTSSRSGYQGRSSTWTSVSDEGVEEEEHHNVPQLHTGSRRRPSESDGQTPQFLVEDDLYDDEYGERRLVAPPVLGEAPASFRDF